MRKLLNVVAIVCVLVFGLPVQAATRTPVKVQTETQAQYEADINALLDATNAERAKAGVPALVLNQALCEDAEVRANECVVSFSHTRPDGSDWWTLDPANMYGENLAMNLSVADVTAAWMNSPAHKANLLSTQFTKVGFAIVTMSDGQSYIAQEFY